MAKRNTGKQDDQPFIKEFYKLTGRFSPWEVWKDFVVLSATAISNAVDKAHYEEREALYMTTIAKYDKEQALVFPGLLAEVTHALEKNPEQDFLGSIFMALGLGSELGGQFFTPYHLSQVMAEITLGNLEKEIEEKGYLTLADETCGAGSLLIGGINAAASKLYGKKNWQNHLLLVGQDIDYISALMCYIQISLLGAPGYIKIGNTFTEPMKAGDSTENYWFTPMYFSGVWTWRRVFQSLN